MGLCFLCDVKLVGERTRVCSSITPHSNSPYPEKIAELMGEEFVVIVTPADHVCKRCTSLITHMDKLENDMNLVKSALLSYIKKKYGLLPPDQTVKSLNIVNGNIRTDDVVLEVGQRKVPSGLTFKTNPTNSSSKMLKTPHESSSKMKIYKCGFCSFQSKELGHVRFHMRSHMLKKGDGEKTVTQSVPKTVTPVPQPSKKRFYRCQVCSVSFDSRIACLEHIQKDHNNQVEAADEIKDTKDIALEVPAAKAINQQAVVTSTGADRQCQENQNNALDTVLMMLNSDDAPAEETLPGDPMQQMQTSKDESAALDVAMQIAQDDVIKGVEEHMAMGEEVVMDGEENKAGELDIESMLAAIHNDPPSDSQNLI